MNLPDFNLNFSVHAVERMYERGFNQFDIEERIYNKQYVSIRTEKGDYSPH